LRLVAAVVVVAAVAAAGALAYGRLAGGGPASTATSAPPARRLALPLHGGDSFTLNITSRVVSVVNGTSNTTVDSVEENLTVLGFSSDFMVEARLVQGNKSNTAPVPYGALALPVGGAGNGSLYLPLLAPQPLSALCVEVHLSGREGGLLAYSGGASMPGYRYSYVGYYNASTGVLERANITLEIPWANLTISYLVDVVSYTPNSTASRLERTLEGGSFCSQLASSDLRLAGDGFYRVEGGVPQPVSPGEARGALSGPAVFVVLNKFCPHCQRFWPNLLEASRRLDVPVYAIVFSGGTGFANPDIGGFVYNLTRAADVPPSRLGTPAFFIVSSGGRVSYASGEMSAERFVALVRDAIGSSG